MKPESLTIVGSNFQDTDDNRFLDTAPVVVYVFGDTRRYAVSLPAKGEFEFNLVDRTTGNSIRTWRFSQEVTEASMRTLPPGPGFTFVLSLLEGGTDRLEYHEGDLTCTFRPASGDPLRARASAPVQIGQVMGGRPQGR